MPSSAAIAEETLARHARAFPERVDTPATLEVGGDYQWRNEGEAHLFSPQVIHSLQKAVRTGNSCTGRRRPISGHGSVEPPTSPG